MAGWRWRWPLVREPAAASAAPIPEPEAAPPPEAGPPVADQLSALFYASLETQKPDDLIEFMEFCARFRRHSVFNARLIQIQRRGATAVASAKEWRTAGRHVLADARPIIILMPFAPVVHVYDIEDTGPPINREAMNDPFAVTGAVHPANIAAALDRLSDACLKSTQFRVHIERDRMGFNLAGTAAYQGQLDLPVPQPRPGEEHGFVVSSELPRISQKTKKKERWIPVWRVKVNDRMTPAQQLATIAHELGHIFCGHTGECGGHHDHSGWPNRRGLEEHICEMEAEAVAWLVARRAGLETKSAEYLKRHVAKGGTAQVDVSLVERAASRIESMAGLRYGGAGR
ncbi:ImmA/IrrE family metallo-endopeptidase [Novosphingobium sp. PASSN1]|uniref:ImmA/IrrE family metallo-endopeptidase n=1 Tax=Novosphingobium sp. PASSN1 TaxID=2015561 RepID=UPI0025D798D5|nr:ImmA/IrrE family metallo-endopeptidase [Novosphingobium sp. PASSN1]